MKLTRHLEYFFDCFGITADTVLEVLETEEFCYRVKTPSGATFRVTKEYFV